MVPKACFGLTGCTRTGTVFVPWPATGAGGQPRDAGPTASLAWPLPAPESALPVPRAVGPRSGRAHPVDEPVDRGAELFRLF